MGCYYALHLFGKDVCFSKINLDSFIFQATMPSVPGLQRTIRSGFFPHNQAGDFLWKVMVGQMEWSFHESQTHAENRLLWPGPSTSWSIHNFDIAQRGITLASQEHRLKLPHFQCQSFILNVTIFFHRNSTVSCNSANVTESLLCASYRIGARDTDLNPSVSSPESDELHE